jgi:hypothetical protein
MRKQTLASGNRKAAVFLGLTVSSLLLLVSPPTSASPDRRSAGPLVQINPNELRLSQALVALAADADHAAFAFCNQLVGLWRPGATTITQLGPVNQWSCPPPRGLERVFSLALTGDRTAWAASAGGNIVTNLLFLVTSSNPHSITIAAETDNCCRGVDPDLNRVGDVYGDGGFIAFSSRVKCNDHGAPACASGTHPTLLNQTVWRLRRPPFQAPCLGKPGPCSQLLTQTNVLRPLSIDSGRIVLQLANGSLIVRKSTGALVHQFPGLAGQSRGAELMGNRLLVLIQGKLLVYSLPAGNQVGTRPLPNVSSAGVCGLPPCPTATLQLVDASRGLVAYILSGKLHLLRIRDGRDRIVAAATDSRFGDKGLFYSYNATGPWPSRIRFVRWAALPMQP